LALAQEPVQNLPLPRSLTLVTAGLAGKIQTLTQNLGQAAPGSVQADLAALGLGVCQVMNGQYDQGAGLLAQAPDKPASLAAIRGLYLGLARFKTQDYAQALQVLGPLADGDPGGFPGPEGLLLAAYCLEGLNRSQEALIRYRQLLDLPETAFRPAYLWRAGACAAKVQDYASAQDYLRELILDNPGSSSADKALPLARDLFRRGQIGFDPDSAACLTTRAQTLLEKGLGAKGLAVVDQLALAPGADPARVLYLKGKGLYARRETQASIQALSELVERFPDWPESPWAMYHLARALWRLSATEDRQRLEDTLNLALAKSSGPQGPNLQEACRRLLLLSNLEWARFPQALGLAQDIQAMGTEATETTIQAAWLAGLIRLAMGDPTGAEAALLDFQAKYPGEDATAGVDYWLARVREIQGREDEALAGYRSAASGWPGYYAMLAGERLRQKGQALPPVLPGNCPWPVTPSGNEEVHQGLSRVELLQSCLLPELAEEVLWPLAARFPQDQALVLAYAQLAASLGHHAGAARAAAKIFGPCLRLPAGQQVEAVRDILYPRRFTDLLVQNLGQGQVDVNVLCGLIRQESFFEPGAVSGAGALGLMQVLPVTARSLAAQMGVKNFQAEELRDPAINIRYGVRFFLDRYREYGGNLAYTLASYNAGRVKLKVWMDNLGGLDQDLFVEFIPYSETRDYVKRILANADIYGRIY